MNQRQKWCWEQERWIYVSLQAGREGRQDPSQSIPSGLLVSWGSITGKKGARAKLRLNKSVPEDRVLHKNHLTWSLDNLPGFPQNLLFQNGSSSTANFYFATVKVLQHDRRRILGSARSHFVSTTPSPRFYKDPSSGYEYSCHPCSPLAGSQPAEGAQ